MELSITKSDLSRAVSITQSVVERKTTMPILSNVLLSVSDGVLRVSSTDFEITAIVNVKAKVISSGSTTVGARVLGDIVKELPEGEVNLKLTDGERLEINSKNSRFKIVGVSAEEFPSLPGLSGEAKGKIISRDLIEMINKTVYAVSQDETRFNLNGVCFQLAQESKKDKATLKMVATDGHRLALISRAVEGLDFSGSIIVPRKGLLEIRRIVEEDQSGTVGIDVRDGFLMVETAEAKISVRLIDGEFPDYQQVIPKQKGTLASINTQLFAQALRRVALMATDKSKGIRLDFSPQVLRISSHSPELGEAREETPVEYQGNEVSVGFNSRYLIDFTQSVGDVETVQVELNGELGAGKFYSAADESYFGIIMPMRL